MVIRVVANDVPFVHHPPDQLRRGFQIVSHDEKARGRIVRLEGIENRCRVAVFEACIKGQVDHLFFSVSHVDRVVALKRLPTGVSDRLFSLLAEAQPPRACFDCLARRKQLWQSRAEQHDHRQEHGRALRIRAVRMGEAPLERRRAVGDPLSQMEEQTHNAAQDQGKHDRRHIFHLGCGADTHANRAQAKN